MLSNITYIGKPVAMAIFIGHFYISKMAVSRYLKFLKKKKVAP